MATIVEKTITATEFKAKCLELMDQLEARQLDRVLITKRGRVVSMALPPPAPASERPSFDSLYGCMKGSTNIPEDFDWEAPLSSPEELARQETRFRGKFKDFL